MLDKIKLDNEEKLALMQIMMLKHHAKINELVNLSLENDVEFKVGKNTLKVRVGRFYLNDEVGFHLSMFSGLVIENVDVTKKILGIRNASKN